MFVSEYRPQLDLSRVSYRAAIRTTNHELIGQVAGVWRVCG